MSAEDYTKRIIKQKPHDDKPPRQKITPLYLPVFEGCSVEGEPGLFGLINKDGNQTVSPIVLPSY